MSSFDKVIVIYNPKSTNDAEKIARDFASEIAELEPELVATKHAGHAKQISYDAAKQSKNPLIISASGDGGYNEVINGAMKAQDDGLAQDPTVAVLLAGNANDHARTVHGGKSLATLVKKHFVKKMSLLRLTYQHSGNTTIRYAHSYIGFGVSARAGLAINKADKGSVSEAVAAAGALSGHTPVKLRRNGIVRKYDSLIFANIPNMAKYLKVGSELNLTVGLFEVHKITHRTFAKRLFALLKLTIPYSQHVKKYSQYKFKLISKEKVQFDGEIITLQAGTTVQVASVKQAISTVRK